RALRVRGARGALSSAILGEVADARGAAALGRARLEAVRRAVVAHAIAALRHVADARRWAADRRALRVRGARRALAGAVLGEIADAGRGAAFGRGGLEAVGRAVVVHPVAALGDVALPCGRTADRRALRIDRAARAVAATV